MIEPALFVRTSLASAAVVVPSALVAGRWGLPSALGVLAGGAWNLASLWCLTQLLSTWLAESPSGFGTSSPARTVPARSGPINLKAIGWLLVKFPLLYALAFLVINTQWISIIGFGAGFSLVLLVILGVIWQRARNPVAHGR